jgi:hypothetical protein
MAVVWHRELPRERSQSGKYGETYVYKRAWLIRVDDPATSLPDITNAAGVEWLDAHPDDDTCKALEFDTKPNDASGLLYTYTVTYQVPPVDSKDSGGEDEPGSIEFLMKVPIWSAGSSVVSVPCWKDKDGDVITNSAGDPLEDLSKEEAELRLTLVQYYPSHTDWAGLARDYTNAVNSDTWNGGGARTWKCQGCSAKVGSENVASATMVYWEVTWEFAYRADTWNLKPWDVGFHEKCDVNGTPSASGDKRKTIYTVDKKPVKQPVALQDGVALPPGSPPVVINGGDGVKVYQEQAFSSVFGELYTPSA